MAVTEKKQILTSSSASLLSHNTANKIALFISPQYCFVYFSTNSCNF